MRIDGYTTVIDSGGAGFHRGGNGIEKRYVYLEPGEVSIHDDRWLTYPWGILGGKPGMRSAPPPRRRHHRALALQVRRGQGRAGRRARLPTAGGGGWKDPLDRPVERVEADVAKGLIPGRRLSGTTASSSATRATESLRARIREERGDVLDFDFGPTLDEIRERAEEETGLQPPVPPEPLAWAPMESGEDALARVREKGDRQMTLSEAE